MKYIFVTGGVMSGIGKGIASASVAKILQSKSYKVSIIKVDPYLNQDAGTMNPIEHGEVFVLDDGGEVDMDFGHYYRYTGINLTRDHNITTGKIFQQVLEKERRGDYLGQTVQIIPHVTNEIKSTIRELAKKDGADIMIVEIGGTTGDIENMSFLEAVRQMKVEEPTNVLFIHVTLVPDLNVVGEQKTKPTQHSVRMLREAGIEPDVIIGRSKEKLSDKTKKKIALFCNVKEDAVVSSPDRASIYEIPLVLEEEKLSETILRKLKKRPKKSNLTRWKKLVSRINNATREVTIAIPGKYTKLHDSYVSIAEALKHAGAKFGAKINLLWIETDEFETNPQKIEELKKADGIIVPGGFGARGTIGKLLAIEYARKNKIPLLGLCYGFQLSTIEYARNAAGLENANSTEIDPSTPHPVIDILPEQKKISKLGGTMRLGAYPAQLLKGSKLRELYGQDMVYERHRHRYEVNPDYIERLEKTGLVFSGKNPDAPLMEMLELPTHPFFVGTQAHPEFKSTLENPAPLFVGLVQAALKRQKKA